jgi:glucosylceramidase
MSLVKNKKIIVSVIAILLVAVITITLFIVFGNNGYDTTIKEGAWVQIYETTGTKSSLLARKSDQILSKYNSGSMNISVTVNTTDKKQNYYGCGLAMTHSSAYLLMNLDKELRTEILQELFGANGARLSIVRIPIGASDYVETDEFFTCDDIDISSDANATDMNLEHFSIKNDSNIIAVMKEIYEINSEILVMATPWSAPAWMKSSKSLKGGELEDQ